MFNLMGLLGRKDYFAPGNMHALSFDLIQLLLWKYRTLCLGEEESMEHIRETYADSDHVLTLLNESCRCMVSVERPA